MAPQCQRFTIGLIRSRECAWCKQQRDVDSGKQFHEKHSIADSPRLSVSQVLVNGEIGELPCEVDFTDYATSQELTSHFVAVAD